MKSLSLSLSHIFVRGGEMPHSDGPNCLGNNHSYSITGGIGGIELYQCGILHMSIRVPPSHY